MGIFGFGSSSASQEKYDRSDPHPQLEPDVVYSGKLSQDELESVFDSVYSNLDSWEEFRIEEPKHIDSDQVIFTEDENIETATVVGVYSPERRSHRTTLDAGFRQGEGYELEDWMDMEHTPPNGYTFTHVYQIELPTGDEGTEFYTFGPEPESIYAKRVSNVIDRVFEDEIEDLIAGNRKAADSDNELVLESFGEHFRDDLVERCGPHYLDEDYDDAVRNAFILLEEEIRDEAGYEQDLHGTDLINQAFSTDGGPLSFGETNSEQLGVQRLYKGAIQSLRNPSSHRFLDDLGEDEAFNILSTANLLLTWLEDNSIESN